MGSSFLPSDIIAAFLYAQLEHLDEIQQKRLAHWSTYLNELKPLAERGSIKLPFISKGASNNAHMFYIVCKNLEDRTGLIAHLKSAGINAVFHYLSLHKSPFYESKHDGRVLPLTDFYSDTLLRLPMYFELSVEEIKHIANSIKAYYEH
jgi:dTDP-4-amino-4,6-dideoxygalactose transaminase